MKILYITPKINNEGGVARVLSVKTNYLIKKWGYEVAILTQNYGNSNPFYNFNSKITNFDSSLNKKKINFIFEYKKQVQKVLKSFNPDIIVITDNGLKGFLFPFIIKTKIPIVFEIHGSKYNEEKLVSKTYLQSLKYKVRDFAIKKFDHVVALSNESASEWNLKISTIIPNPIENTNAVEATLNAKKAIVVSRNSYEKGLDRLFQIWSKVIKTNPDWILEIYGVDTNDKQLLDLVSKHKLEQHISLFNPVKNITEKYQNSSIYLMTSRNEGFPMVLLEAMNNGLPCIAYNCPIGPKAIIENNENGFLIEDGNSNIFVQKINLLINNFELRKKLGKNAKKSILKYDIAIVMNQWNSFFKSIKS